MPFSKKGNKIFANMVKEYGPKKGKEVFYSSVNKGTIKGVHNPIVSPVLFGNEELQKTFYKKKAK
jgi:hypothetical protein